MKFQQIIAAQWEGKDNKLTYSIYGLGQDGVVYRHTQKGWQDVESLSFDQEKKGYWAKRHTKKAQQPPVPV